MNKLTIITDNCPVETETLANAVYTELKQTDNLSIELVFVSAEEIQTLNREHRNIDSVTDVLSFPSLDGIRYKAVTKEEFPDDYDDETQSVFIGSIAVCTERAEEQAAEYGHSVKREITYLILHGILHCLGYDHMTEEDEKEMTELAEKIMTEIKIGRDVQ